MVTKKQTKRKNTQKIEWRKIIGKAISDGLVKSIEYLVLAAVVGISLKIVLSTVPAVIVGTIIVNVSKLKLIQA